MSSRLVDKSAQGANPRPLHYDKFVTPKIELLKEVIIRKFGIFANITFFHYFKNKCFVKLISHIQKEFKILFSNIFEVCLFCPT